jgi:hypothetical protein
VANVAAAAAAAELNIRSMQLWQQQHSSLATFCGCLMLHDERPDPEDPAYPITPVPAEQLLQLGEAAATCITKCIAQPAAQSAVLCFSLRKHTSASRAAAAAR